MKKLCPLLLICLLLTGCSSDDKIKEMCLIDGCYNEVKPYSAYCSEHSIDDLIDANEKNKLTETQLTKCRAVVDEYCENLKKTQSDIQAIYVPDDEPEVYAFYIMYKCYVTRGDNVDTATIHVIMSDGDVFKVDKLEYDK